MVFRRTELNMKTLKIIQDFHASIQGSLNPLPLKAGTVLAWTQIVNNGTYLFHIY
jgi:hypothetical protein